MTLPQTDPPEAALPQGAERSEQFVLEVSEYFERLDVRPLGHCTESGLISRLFFLCVVDSDEHTILLGSYPAVEDRTLGDQRTP